MAYSFALTPEAPPEHVEKTRRRRKENKKRSDASAPRKPAVSKTRFSRSMESPARACSNEAVSAQTAKQNKVLDGPSLVGGLGECQEKGLHCSH